VMLWILAHLEEENKGYYMYNGNSVDILQLMKCFFNLCILENLQCSYVFVVGLPLNFVTTQHSVNFDAGSVFLFVQMHNRRTMLKYYFKTPLHTPVNFFCDCQK